MIQSLNPNIANDRISMPYPHVRILTPSDAIALVVPSLPEGDLAIICEFNGTTRKIGSVAHSATTLSKLSRIAKIQYAKSADTVIDINNIDDIMEALS